MLSRSVFNAPGSARRTAWRVLALGVLALALSGCGVNRIPTLQEQAKAAWSQVENQYQRRADLIPNLVETVKGYATQEREVLTQVIAARARATQVNVTAADLDDPQKVAQYAKAQDALTRSLGRLLVTVERYPDLKSNQNFLVLQSQLEGTENRIAVARKDYIDAVRAYNTELETFPGRLWAMTLYSGYKPMVPFTAAPGAEQAPRVNFGPQQSPAVNFAPAASGTTPALPAPSGGAPAALPAPATAAPAK